MIKLIRINSIFELLVRNAHLAQPNAPEVPRIQCIQNPLRIHPDSKQNPYRIHPVSSQNPSRYTDLEYTQNPFRIHTESTQHIRIQNPFRIPPESIHNPSSISGSRIDAESSQIRPGSMQNPPRGDPSGERTKSHQECNWKSISGASPLLIS